VTRRDAEPDSSVNRNSAAHDGNVAHCCARGLLGYVATVTDRPTLIRMRSLGANIGAIDANGFLRQTNWPGDRVAIMAARGQVRTALNA
jgi:hypothetical protein